MIVKNDSAGNETIKYEANSTTTIYNNHQYLHYKGFDHSNGALFYLQKTQYMSSFSIGFDLRFYPSYQGFEGTSSGATVFRPATNESFRYCSGKEPSQVYYQQS